MTQPSLHRAPARARHASPTRRPTRRLLAALAVAVLGLLNLTVTSGPVAAAGSGTLLLEDNFMSATTVAQSYIAGGRNFTACLTAGASSSSTPVPGCALPEGVRDADGSGALRLTAATNNQAGFLLYDKALPTKAGLDITFNQYQWGGTKADGISFFLTDGAYTLSSAGAFGGSLGYHHQNGGSAPDGVAHALLGVGFDVWGNYSVETNDTATCGTGYTNAALQKNTVAVRGPGNGKTGYCLLGPVSSAPELDVTSGTRPAAVVTRVVIDPPTDPSPKVTVFLNGRQVTQVPQPAALLSTPTFKFGWGASTGGSNDNHEINFLSVESVVPILPDLSLTSATTAATAQSSASVTMTARTSAAAGPVPANQPVTITAPAPAGATFGAVTGSGWDCSATTASALSCARTSATAVDPGTTLPVLTATLDRSASAPSGTSTLTATVTSASDDAALAADNSSAALVRWHPVASAVDAGVVDATSTPATVTAAAPVVGTAPYTWAVGAPSDPSVGTVTIDTDGLLSLTPAAGASGLLQAAYTATDGSGGVSNAALATLRVRPAVTGGSLTTDGTATASVTLAPVVGTGAFSVGSTSVAPGLAGVVVSVDGAGRPVVTARGAVGFSGPSAVTFTVLDASGVESAPATVTVLVHPVAGDDTAETTLDAGGHGTLTAQLPVPAGSGPFTYAIDGDGDLGGAQATVSSTGELTVTADQGVSGVRTVRYTVADGTSTSTPAEVVVTVRPFLGGVADVPGDAEHTATSVAPVAHGTGLTFEHTTPAGTSVSTASDGRVTLDTGGASGTFVVQLTARDADGTASAPVPVVFVVTPTAHAVAATTTSSTTPVAVSLAPDGTGTGPLVTALATGLAPSRGSATVVGDDVRLTPAPGVSGRLVATYTLTDPSGLSSASATATLDVAPVARDASGRVASGAVATVSLPEPLGTGPFTWTVTSATSGAVGAAEVVDGVLTVAASATYSGPAEVRYTVTDPDGLVSAEALVTLAVVPTAPEGTSGTPATEPGRAGTPVSGPRPTPSGTGPFRFTITDAPDPATGTATIDPETGVVTFVPAPGFSGTVEVGYAATDANGVVSDPGVVRFAVAPVATPADAGQDPVPGLTPSTPARTVPGTPATVQLPAPVGTGPFTYELTGTPDATWATATLDPATGRLVVSPLAGRSGRIQVTYRVVDATGLASGEQTVWVEVRPVLAAPDAVVYSPGVATTRELPDPVGTGPFAWSIVTGPEAAQGTASLEVATGRITFAPAAGYTGQAVVTYVVTDADGVRSEPATVTFRSAPSVLARTGAEVAPLAGIALGLLAAGTGLLLVRRRLT